MISAAPLEVFAVFLRLGLTSFGGPIAHLGYFRSEFVERRAWMDEKTFSDLVALCQLLPGPASSQVGMAIGLARAGWAGLGAAFGVSRRAGALFLLLFVVLLAGLPVWAAAGDSMLPHLVDGFYRAGALVFGGGHVVLPLLQSAVLSVGAVSDADFLAGYGAAQAVPGPLFTFAAYLGAVMAGPGIGLASAWSSGLLFLLVTFLPAFLLLVGVLPFWDSLRRRAGIRSAVAGVNAAVVGILLAALYDPVWTGAIRSRTDFGLALAGFGLLVTARMSPAIVVALAALAGWMLYR